MPGNKRNQDGSLQYIELKANRLEIFYARLPLCCDGYENRTRMGKKLQDSWREWDKKILPRR